MELKLLLYKKTTLKSVQIKINNEVMRAIENNPQIKSEMRRVFQMANRRIQNIRQHDLISPAVTALGEIPNGYTVFGMSGSFNDLKIRYAKAIAFLQQPTSTASGARTYGEYIKSTYHMSDTEYKAVGGTLNKVVQSLSDSQLGQAMLQYKDFSGYFATSASDSAALTERASIEAFDELNSTIANALESAQQQIDPSLEKLFAEFDI